jgi:CRISPR/Cas system CSM-associated protein Csm3 (group 7 of RAMP superfamily)
VTIAGPLRVGSGEPPEPAGDQGQQVTPMLRVGEQFVLPGSGLKGLLRSRAEYILRSVSATPTPCLNQRCGSCWTCQVFGHGGGQDPDTRAVGARALVRIPDVTVADPVPARRQHVAIDRFTAGAHPGLLYTVDALESGTFDLIIEPLDSRLADQKIAEIRAILRLVLEDLDDGIAGVGAGVARGYGTVRVNLADAVECGDLPDGPSARATLRQLVGTSAPARAAQ